jgi:uncharacterized protein YcbK (DUF882 family)
LQSLFIKQKHTYAHLLRRDFLKLGLVVTAAVLNPFSAQAAFDSRPKIEKKLAFYNTHTGESVHPSFYRNGKYGIEALTKI